MMDARHRRHGAAGNCWALGLIVLVALLSVAVDLSGVAGFTLTPYTPITLRLGRELGGGTRVLLRAQPQPDGRLDDRTMDETRRLIAGRVDHDLNVPEPAVRTLKEGRNHYIAVDVAGSRASLTPDALVLLQRTGAFSLLAVPAPPPPFGAPSAGYRVLARSADLRRESITIGLDDNPQGTPPDVAAALRAPAAGRVARYLSHSPTPFLGLAMDGHILDVQPSAQVFTGPYFQITRTYPFTTNKLFTTPSGVPLGRAIVEDTGMITGMATLAATMKYGPLPVSLTLAGMHAIGPTINPAVSRLAAFAGAVALLVVAALLAVVYGRRGLLLGVALVVDALALLALVKVLALVLTLAAALGFVAAIVAAAIGSLLLARRAAGRHARPWEGVAIGTGGSILVALCAALWWSGAVWEAGAATSFATVLALGVAIAVTMAAVALRSLPLASSMDGRSPPRS